MSVKKIIGIIVGVLFVGFLIIQLIPGGRNHDNPPVKAEPAWDSPQTKQLFYQACGDCHSNETVWPWYSNIAPVSWLVQNDVDDGRAHLNVSEWGTRDMEADDAAGMIRAEKMPLPTYLIMHPKARLNVTDRQNLIEGLSATFGNE